MEAFIRNLFLESLSGFIQAQVLRRDNGIIFIWLKMRQGSRFACRVMTLKKWLVNSLNQQRGCYTESGYQRFDMVENPSRFYNRNTYKNRSHFPA